MNYCFFHDPTDVKQVKTSDLNILQNTKLWQIKKISLTAEIRGRFPRLVNSNIHFRLFFYSYPNENSHVHIFIVQT